MLDDPWFDYRAQMMLAPDVINLNTGSFGPLPHVVFERVTQLRRCLAAEPMDFFVRQVPPLLSQARQRLAQWLGGAPQRLAFTVNVTAAINLVASSLRPAAPGEILLTDHEYGAMHWCWERAAQRLGLSIRTFALPLLARTADEIVEAACAAMNARTRILFFSHVLSPTGLVLPARQLCAAARQRGIVTVIDGAHAPAMIPLNLDELECDFYGANCHKWLLAPTGSGFLYWGRYAQDFLEPLQVSWGYRYGRSGADEPDEFGSTPRIRSLEFEGTRDLCPWLTVPTAIDFLKGIGWQRVRARMADLVKHVRQRLDGWTGLQCVTPDVSQLHGALTAFRLPAGADAQALRKGLWERFRIEAPIVDRPEGPLLRVSTHFYNTEAEVDLLAKALKAILVSSSEMP